jgi:hypothetical protein
LESGMAVTVNTGNKAKLLSVLKLAW